MNHMQLRDSEWVLLMRAIREVTMDLARVPQCLLWSYHIEAKRGHSQISKLEHRCQLKEVGQPWLVERGHETGSGKGRKIHKFHVTRQ